MSYRIFTDATADLNEELLKELPPIEIIPMEITLDQQTYTIGRNGNLDLEDFYKKLRSGKSASTSQINPWIYYDAFEETLRQGKDILYLGFTSGLSNSVLSAEWSAMDLREHYPDRKIFCIDTLCASAGEGFLVYEAALRQAEGMDLDKLVEWVEANRLHVCHWFTVDTFYYLKHGGRVSAATAALGTTLNIKPLLNLSDQGTLEVQAKPRGQKKALKVLLNKLEEDRNPEIGEQIFIAHGDALERAEEIKKLLTHKYPDARIRITEIGAIIGAHTGPGMIAVIFWGNHR